MSLLSSPRSKMIAALAALLLLAVAGSVTGFNLAVASRWILGLASLAGLGWWLRRARRESRGFSLPPRLKVVSRAGLSPRCGAALVEVDGRTYFVVHGDGYAQIKDSPTLPAPDRRLARRPPTQRRLRKAGVK